MLLKSIKTFELGEISFEKCGKPVVERNLCVAFGIWIWDGGLVVEGLGILVDVCVWQGVYVWV